MADRETLEPGAPPCGGRQRHAHDQLAGRAAIALREVRGDVESLATLDARELEHGLAREQRRNEIGLRERARGEVAGERGDVADGGERGPAGGLRQRAERPGSVLERAELDVCRQRSEARRVTRRRPRQLGDVSDRDVVPLERRAPQRCAQDPRPPAQQTAVFAVPVEQVDRLVNRRDTVDMRFLKHHFKS